MKLDVAILSRCGDRIVNEDAGGVWSDANACVCVLADGAGAHGGGDVAAKLVVREMLEFLRRSPAHGTAAVAAALDHANRAVLEAQRQGLGLEDMHATAVVLAIDTARAIAVWGHLGDSRLYCFRNGGIVAQTRDHSVVQGMVDAGYLSPADLRSAPGRNQLLTALGSDRECCPSSIGEAFPLREGDSFLLCTDGLWEYVEEREMLSALAAAASAELWLRAMEAHVLACANDSQDNYSGIAVCCRDSDRRGSGAG